MTLEKTPHSQTPMRVLAIDPGYDRIGFAILEQNPKDRSEQVLYSACLVTSRDDPFYKRLQCAGEEMESIIKKFSPNTCALEKLFFVSNQKTAMGVSEARGVFLYIAAHHGLFLFEYTPLQIKSAVTGNGHSDKKQVSDMIHRLISIKKNIQHDDEYDAIAIGLTCLASEKNVVYK